MRQLPSALLIHSGRVGMGCPWDGRNLAESIHRNHERLPGEIRKSLPLKGVWILVPEVPES